MSVTNLCRLLGLVALATVGIAFGCSRTPDVPKPDSAPDVQSEKSLDEALEETRLLQIIDKAIEAHGGEDNLDRMKTGRATIVIVITLASLKLKGEMTVEEYFDLPRRYKRIMKTVIGDTTRLDTHLIIGERGWQVRDDGKVIEFQADRIEPLCLAGLSRLIEIRDQDCRLKSLGEVEIEGRPALGIKISYDKEWIGDLYFDKNSFLVLKCSREAEQFTSRKKGPMETYCFQHQDFQGLRLPAKTRNVYEMDHIWEITLKELQVLDKLDDKIFEIPEPKSK